MASDTQKTGAGSEYIASRYDGLATGAEFEYTFESQRGVPYDGTNRQARRLSPFTFRLVVPEALVSALSGTTVDVNLLGRASQQSQDATDQANQIRSALGIPQVSGSNAAAVLNDLRSTLSAGQAIKTTLGDATRAVLTDLLTVADIKYQVERMLQVPPLTLFVNPNSLSISYNAVQQRSNRTRYGLVFERWGEGQPTLSISGSTGSFVVGGPVGTTTGSRQDVVAEVPSGVQFAAKRESAAFQQLMSLFQIYKNNGYIYDTVGKSEAHLFIGSVAIDYDQMTYVGNINSFEYTYNQDMPHRLEWSMEFTVSRMYDHAQEPVVVLPQVSSSVGGFSDADLRREMASTPTQGTVGPNGFVRVSGIDQGETPLSVIGAYLTPTGLTGR